MLILIPGVTGNLGQHLCRAALQQGHQVRGLGRSPDKLDPSLKPQLESWVDTTGIEDAASYDRACAGVDAIIVAWPAYARFVVDGQILLLRAAERAGVKRFHAASWNLDWEHLPLHEIETYDAMIFFADHALMTSPIKLCHTFTGVLGKTLFGVPGAGILEGNSAFWVREGSVADNRRTIKVIGSGDVELNFTPEADAAEFTVALMTSEYAEKGGYFRFCSDSFTPLQLGEAYKRVYPDAEVLIEKVMELDECEAVMRQTRKEAREAGQLQERLVEYLGLAYGYYIASGKLNITPVDADKFPGCKRTSVEEYIRGNDYV